MMDKAVIAARVEAGANWLDTIEPEWFKRVNNGCPLDRYAMESGRGPCGCILARTFGSYLDAEDVYIRERGLNAVNYGFNADFRRIDDDVEEIPDFLHDGYSDNRRYLQYEEFDALAEAWQIEVQKRVGRDADSNR